MNQKKHYDVVAAVVVIDGDILCMQRGKSKYTYTSEKWEFPGGKIEIGETAEQAIVRELHEEMDYDIRPVRRLVKIEHDYPDFSISLDAWLCQADTRQFKMKEHIDSRWMNFDNISALDFAAADVKILAALSRDNKLLRNLNTQNS